MGRVKFVEEIVGNKAKGRILKRECVSGGKKCLFFGNFDVLCFLEEPVLRFAFLLYYRRNYDLLKQTISLKGFKGRPPQTLLRLFFSTFFHITTQ